MWLPVKKKQTKEIITVRTVKKQRIVGTTQIDQTTTATTVHVQNEKANSCHPTNGDLLQKVYS